METLSAVSNIALCAAVIYACCIVMKSIREERKMMERRIDMMFPHLIEEEGGAGRDPRTQWRPSQKMLNEERGEAMTMITVKTDSLKGAALDWAVAKADPGCNGLKWAFDSNLGTFTGVADIYGNENKICAFLTYSDARYDFRKFMLLQRDGATYYRPSADWSQGGPLIDLYQVSVVGIENTIFHATAFYDGKTFCLCAKGEGPTRLVAAMRAIVSLKLGDTVEVPAELVGGER